MNISPGFSLKLRVLINDDRSMFSYMKIQLIKMVSEMSIIASSSNEKNSQINIKLCSILIKSIPMYFVHQKQNRMKIENPK